MSILKNKHITNLNTQVANYINNGLTFRGQTNFSRFMIKHVYHDWKIYLDFFDMIAEKITGVKPHFYGNCIDVWNRWGPKNNTTQFARIVGENEEFYTFSFNFFGKLEDEGKLNSFSVSKKNGKIFSKGYFSDIDYINHGVVGKKIMSEYLEPVLKKSPLEIALGRYENAEHSSNKNHPYLISKGIKDMPPDVRIDRDGNLLIPFYSMDDLKKIVTIQTIAYIPEGKFLKKNAFGCSWDKACRVIWGKNKAKDELVLCEGFSTGMTISQALNYDSTVVICGSSSNMLKNANFLFRNEVGIELKDKKIIVAADNDWHKDRKIFLTGDGNCVSKNNVGLVVAEKIALTYDSCYTYPKFNDFGNTCMGTDFNDLFLLSSIENVKKQFEENICKPEFISSRKMIEKDNSNVFDDLVYLKHIDGSVWIYDTTDSKLFQFRTGSALKEIKKTISKLVEKNGYVIKGFKYRPGDEKLLDTKSGIFYFNTWRCPTFTGKFLVEYIDIFYSFSRYICNDDDEIHNLFLDWIANLIQNPGSLTPIIPVLLSPKKGVGKTLFCEILCELVGHENFSSQNSKSFFKSLNGFNKAISHKQLILVDELRMSGPEYDLFKQVSTSVFVECNEKFVEQYTERRTANFICCGNNVSSLYFDHDERRFLFLDLPERRLEQEKLDMIGKLLKNDKNFIYTIYDFLSKREIKNDLTYISERILSETTKQLIEESSFTSEQQKLRALLVKYNVTKTTIAECSLLKDRDCFYSQPPKNNQTQIVRVLRGLGFEKSRLVDNGARGRFWTRKLDKGY